MADLNELQAAQSVKIVGADATGLESNAVNSTSSGDLQTADIINVGTGVQGALTVSTTALEVKVGSFPLSERKLVTVYNNGTGTVFWGFTSSVTSTDGTPILKNQNAAWSVGDNQAIYLISASGSNNVRITESA